MDEHKGLLMLRYIAKMDCVNKRVSSSRHTRQARLQNIKLLLFDDAGINPHLVPRRAYTTGVLRARSNRNNTAATGELFAGHFTYTGTEIDTLCSACRSTLSCEVSSTRYCLSFLS